MRVITPQNWTVLKWPTKPKSPVENSTHASVGLRATGAPPPSTKRQAKSFTALMVAGLGSNCGGLIAGTPPAVAPALSQTAALPLPRGRDTAISRSGNELPSCW